jgi:hypothetical protein
MSRNYHFDVYADSKKETINLRVHVGTINEIVKSLKIGTFEQLTFILKSDDEFYYFYVMNGKKKIYLGKEKVKLLSSEVSGTFTGVMFGVFSKEIHKKSSQIVVTDIEYKELNN